MDVVGRAREMDEFRRLYASTLLGAGGVIAVIGSPGAGKSALLDATMQDARQLGFRVYRRTPVRGQPGRLVWAQLLRDIGSSQQSATKLLDDAVSALDLDQAAGDLTRGIQRLIVIDDIDRGGPEAIEMLSVLAARVAAAGTAVIVTARTQLGVAGEMRLGGLSPDDLAKVVGDIPAEVRQPLWVASRGLPGVARTMADAMARRSDGSDPIVYLALSAESSAEFLDIDANVVRLLEAALPRAVDDASRARVLARLAHELLGDSTAGGRRRALIDEAIELAGRSGDQLAVADVLGARLHALWDPHAAQDRLATASEIIELARRTGDDAMERQGLFWRFVALMELARVGEAESALTAYEREVELAGDAAGAVMATARHAMLAILRGRFDQASALIKDVHASGHRAGVPDTDLLTETLHGAISMERDPVTEGPRAAEALLAAARHRPGHYYEATAALVLLGIGREAEARSELDRVLPRLLTGSGPRWLGAAADLAVVAAASRLTRAAEQLYDALLPYDGRLVVLAGANMARGPVSHYLGVLAAELGLRDEAVHHLRAAVALEEQIGALPSLAHSLSALADALEGRAVDDDVRMALEARGRARSVADDLGMTGLLATIMPAHDEWRLTRDGTDWLLEAGKERARLRDGRGMDYLRALVTAPGRDIPALDLVAGGAGLVASRDDPVLDDTAQSSYRNRLSALAAELDAADRVGDAARADRAETERQAVLDELRRASGLGGRSRPISAEAERARVNVTRTLRATIAHIAVTAPHTAAHLQVSVRTGKACRYDPAQGGPTRWQA